jgi:hypothetical protein
MGIHEESITTTPTVDNMIFQIAYKRKDDEIAEIFRGH